MESRSRNGAEAAYPGVADGELLAERAEEVRAWFVQVRGGAPFLSGSDARALTDWLEGGVSPVAILRAVEQAAAHRRSKRLRTPFTLKACGRWLAKAAPAGEGTRKAPPGDGSAAGGDAAPPQAELTMLYVAAVAEVRAVAGEDVEDVILRRCAVGRRFHEAAWGMLGARRGELMAAAATELEELRAVMDDEAFERVCEEAARSRARGWFPALSVEVLCQPPIEEAVRGLD